MPRRFKGSLTVKELYDTLSNLIDEEKGNYEVKLLMQPSWPFIYSIGSIGLRSKELDEDADMADEDNLKDLEKIVYIVEGIQESYGFKFEEIDNL